MWRREERREKRSGLHMFDWIYRKYYVLTFISPNKFIIKIYSITNLMVLILYKNIRIFFI